MTNESFASTTCLALLCVDLQPVFLRVIADSESLQRRCAFAIRAAAGLEIATVFTEQVPEKLGHTAPDLLTAATAPRVFGKNCFSALRDETTRSAIINGQTEHVLLCGIETPVCVYQTALDLMAGGVQVTLLSDCLGARRAGDAEVCLQALTRAGAHVLPSETVFYSLLADVTHPFFKPYTQLVKEYS